MLFSKNGRVHEALKNSGTRATQVVLSVEVPGSGVDVGSDPEGGCSSQRYVTRV